MNKDAIVDKLKNPSHLLWMVPLLLLGGGIFTGKVIYWGTPMLQFVPWWDQAVDMLRAGELPLWNAEVGMGAPLFANYQSALLYPPTWLYLIGGLIGGVGVIAWLQAVLIVFHLAVAGYGMAAVLKRLGVGVWAQVFGGLAFGMSAYLVSRSQFLSINAAAAWLPWVLAFGYDLAKSRKVKRSFVWLVGILTLQLLSGHAQISWYTLLLAVAWIFYWGWKTGGFKQSASSILKLAGAYITAGLIAAPQLWATAEYMLNSQRASEVGLENTLSYSFNGWQLLTLLMPNLFGNPVNGNYWGYANFWEEAVYIGLSAVFCGFFWLLSMRRKANRSLKIVLILGSILTVILAMGRFTDVFPWLYEHVPTFSLFQAPARMNIWLVFALALAAGIGFERWRRPEGRGLYWSRLAVAGGVGILLVGLFGRAAVPLEIREQALGQTFFTSVTQFGIMLILLSVLNLLAPKRDREEVSWWKPLIVGFLAVDLLIANAGILPFADVSLYTDLEDMAIDRSTRIYIPSDLHDELKFDQFYSFESFEIPAGKERVGPSLIPNVFSLADQPSANNFDPFVPANYAEWIRLLDAYEGENKDDLYALMNVDWVAESVEDGVVQWRKVESDLGIGEFRFEEEDDSKGFALVYSLFLDLKNNGSKLLINTNLAGWYIQSQVYYPGWKVKINGRIIPINEYDNVFREIKMSDGDSELEIYYQPDWLLYGWVLSALGIGIASITWYKAGKYGKED